MTVEASLVMPVVLMALVLMISAGWKSHDRVFENLAVNEAVELFGHLPVPDPLKIRGYTEQRLKHTIHDTADGFSIERYLDGSKAVLRTADGDRQLKDSGFRPEKIMRAVTLTEEVLK